MTDKVTDSFKLNYEKLSSESILDLLRARLRRRKK